MGSEAERRKHSDSKSRTVRMKITRRKINSEGSDDAVEFMGKMTVSRKGIEKMKSL